MKITLAAMLLAFAVTSQAQIRLAPFVTGLSEPVQMTQDPGQPTVQYVVQRAGRIRVIQAGSVLPANFIDISPLVSTTSEEGLLGLALPSNYSSTGFAYVFYTDLSGNIQIERYTRSMANPLTLDNSTAYPIINIPHPNYPNHNGGTLRFGPDGLLYIGIGDGGSEDDPNQNGQNPNTLLSKIIRIDPTGDDFPNDPNRNYHIPSDNPFVAGNPIQALGEIWDFGVRNPFRFSFDMPEFGGTGALLIGDVGQDNYEEIDFEKPGTGGYNYGWRLKEGFHFTGLGGTQAYAPLTDPIYEYSHYGSNGNAVIGGYVYRGSGLGTYFQGRYFFCDEATQDTWSFNLNQAGSGSVSDVTEHTSEIGTPGNAAAIDIDSAGELYFVGYGGGTIFKLVSSAVDATSLTAKRGTITSGGLGSLSQFDTDRLAVMPSLQLSSLSPPVTLQLDTTAPSQTASALRFFLVAQASAPGVTQELDLWDWVTSSWVPLDVRTASVGVDARNIFQGTNPNDFIQNGTKAMRAQILYYQSNRALASLWHVQINQAVWGFYP